MFSNITILPTICFAILLSVSFVEAKAPLPGKFFGLTVDDISDTEEVVRQLNHFKSRNPSDLKPIVRVVFNADEQTDPRQFNEKYLLAIKQIRYLWSEEDVQKMDNDDKRTPEVFIMGELMDSFHMHRCIIRKSVKINAPIERNKSVECYRKRAQNYHKGLGDLVDVWEIGNEINGEWVGWKSQAEEDSQVKAADLQAVRDVIDAQIAAAYEVFKNKNTALTFYFNDEDYLQNGSGQYSYSTEEKFGKNYSMFKWAEKYKGKFPRLTYIFISYWQDDNWWVPTGEQIVPNAERWARIFETLGKSFENSSFGFGEVGTQCYYPPCISAKDGVACKPLDIYGKDKFAQICETGEIKSLRKRRCSCCLYAQTEYVQRYYLSWNADIRTELGNLAKAFVGGYFWWYFNDDVINKFTAANDEDVSDTERGLLRTEAEKTRTALVNALNNWRGENPVADLLRFEQNDFFSATTGDEPVFEILQPGDTTTPNPYTIVIVNNPAYKKGRKYYSDPINLQPAKFAESVKYIYANLFGNLPNQAEKLLAEPLIRDKIRVVAAFIPKLPIKEENSLVKVTKIKRKKIFLANQENFSEFLRNYNLDKADVVFAVTAYSPALRASALRTLETADCAGKIFNFDGKIFRHCYYSNAPGAIAIHVNDRSMTALHEFGHAASSYPNGYLNDLSNEGFTEESLIINKKAVSKSNGATPPSFFAVYNGVTYKIDAKRTEDNKNFFYSPQRLDSAFPSLMDDYTVVQTGFPEQCRFDGLTRQFLLDRITTKTQR